LKGKKKKAGFLKSQTIAVINKVKFMQKVEKLLGDKKKTNPVFKRLFRYTELKKLRSQKNSMYSDSSIRERQAWVKGSGLKLRIP